MKINQQLKWLVGVAGLAVASMIHVAGAAQSDDLTADQIDELTQEIIKSSFHDKGIVKVDEVFEPDPTLLACDAADVAGHPISAELNKKFEEVNLKTIEWPDGGNYLGDWKEGEKLAQSGKGKTWKDKPGAANGGNCYNCHQITKEEISFGTIGPTLYQYGKIRGVKDPKSAESEEIVKYTWGKIWNSKAYNACSNMPRAGYKGILTADQIRDIMALLLDPESPVNQ